MLAKQIAEKLLKIKAVSVVDEDHLYTWASGIKSPVYCDNRMTISYPEVRQMIAEGFADRIKADYPDVEVIAGTATAGIPHAAWVADILKLPMVYVRSGSKAHGKSKQIEGVLTAGQKVVLIEDLFSTGGSSLNACDALSESGATLLGVLAIFSYNFDVVTEAFNKRGISFGTLSDYNTLLPIAVAQGYIPEEKLSVLSRWSKNPRMFTEE